MVAIQGKLEEASLPDVLQLLALGKKTGCLALTDQTLQGQIYLDAGRITYATVANRRDRLGDMLVRGGRLTREQLAQALERQTADQGKHLGQILVESGQVERAELERFAHVQIEEAVYFLFTWRRGMFTFESGVKAPLEDFLVSINPEGLLLEGARRVDEWSLIEKKISSFDMVFRLDKSRLAESDVTLTPEQRRILPFLDGQHDVHAVIETSAMEEFDVGKALYGLVSAGFAQLVDRRTVIRHLDYRELLAYMVHEAEFADPERRKEATRHIVDCKLCAPRLKEIHVRRTRETGAVRADTIAAAVQAAGAAPAPAAAPPQPVPRPVAPRRSGERAGPRDASGASDRRHAQRRGGDRRRAVAAAALPAGVTDRRQSPERRHVERRLKDRLGTALARGAAPASRAAPAASRPKRSTGPRQLITVGPEKTAAGAAPRRPAKPAAPPSTPATAPPPSPAVAATLAGPAAQPAAPKPPAAEATAPAPTPPTQASPPAPAAVRPAPPRSRAKSKEIEWLITPEESGVHPVAKLPPPPPPQLPSATASVVTQAARPVAPPATIPRADAAQAATVPQLRAVPVASPTLDAAIQPAQPLPLPAVPSRPWLAIAATAVIMAGMAGLGAAMTLMLRPRMGNGTDSGAAAAVGVATTPAVETERQPAAVPAADSTHRTPATIVAQAPPPVTRPPAREPATVPALTRPQQPVQRPVEAPVRPTAADSEVPRPAAVAPARAQPVQETRVAAEPPVAEPAPRPPTAPPPAAAQPAVAPQPVVAAVSPGKAGLTGATRDARTGTPVAGVRVSIPGTPLTATTSAAGVYEFPNPPLGLITVVAAMAGYAPQRGDVAVEAGVAAALDLVMQPPPAASKPDEELVPARWERIEAADVEALLGQPVAVIPGLWIESIAKPPGTTRPRVRVAQITPSGERVALVETRSGAATRADRPRLTALRLMPPSDAYPVTTGTGSFGNLLVTATTALPPDSLRALLARLIEAPR